MDSKDLSKKNHSFIKSVIALLEELHRCTKVDKKFLDLQRKVSNRIKSAQKVITLDFESYIAKSYLKALSQVDDKLKSQLSKSIQVSFSKTHKDAVASLTKVTKESITRSYGAYNNSVAAYISRLKMTLSEKEMFKDVLKESMFKQGKSVADTSEDMLEFLFKSAKNGHITVGARRMGIEAYLNLIVNTVGRATVSRATENRLLQNGITHIKISSHNSKDWCSFYEGKVFSLIPNDRHGYPHVSKLPNSGTPFHPNCAHSELPFIIDMKTDKELQDARVDKSLLSRDIKKLNTIWKMKNSKRGSNVKSSTRKRP